MMILVFFLIISGFIIEDTNQIDVIQNDTNSVGTTTTNPNGADEGTTVLRGIDTLDAILNQDPDNIINFCDGFLPQNQ